MKLTIFTPTYNRAYILENLYRSLQRQTCHEFEWRELQKAYPWFIQFYLR